MGRRVFFITGMVCRIGGGGGGVNFRLMQANIKYNLFEKAVFIFADTLFDSSKGQFFPVPFEDGVISFEDWYELNEYYRFCENDVFVVHEILTYLTLKKALNFVKYAIVVHHAQGGLAYEYKNYGNDLDNDTEVFLDYITKFTLSNTSYLAFPSKGAIEAFVSTQPGIEELMDSDKNRILYNGCSPLMSNESHDNGVLDEILSFSASRKFVTVASLVEQKGVERLPVFFNDYGKYDKEYVWIIIGNGIKSDELREAIYHYGIEEHVIWIKEYIDNDDVLKIYNVSDFYILSHRISIFDFATIEAMHMGCIPVLTPVGGNLEMICDDNGYLFDDELNGKNFYDWILKHNLYELKELNKRIATEKFSEKSMLQGYYNLIAESFWNKQ